MEIDERTAVAKNLEQMIDNGQAHSALASYLQEAGCSMGEAVALLASVGKMKVSEAKRIIFQSPSWQGWVTEAHDQPKDLIKDNRKTHQ